MKGYQYVGLRSVPLFTESLPWPWKACHDQLCSVRGPEDHALILDRVLVLSVYILRIVVCSAVLGAVLLMCETA
jgi:hypothetical protein